ncbi:MAG: hypothetical protein ABTQ32_10605, partial [Myxococcaceae bacterium]
AFPRDVNLTSIFSKTDHVNPFPSCLVENEFDAPNVRNIEIADIKHREFVTSRSVYQVVRRELFTGYGLPVPAEPKPRRLVPLR